MVFLKELLGGRGARRRQDQRPGLLRSRSQPGDLSPFNLFEVETSWRIIETPVVAKNADKARILGEVSGYLISHGVDAGEVLATKVHEYDHLRETTGPAGLSLWEERRIGVDGKIFKVRVEIPGYDGLNPTEVLRILCGPSRGGAILSDGDRRGIREELYRQREARRAGISKVKN